MRVRAQARVRVRASLCLRLRVRVIKVPLLRLVVGRETEYARVGKELIKLILKLVVSPG